MFGLLSELSSGRFSKTVHCESSCLFPTDDGPVGKKPDGPATNMILKTHNINFFYRKSEKLKR